jgi:hypothetical protein
MHPRHAETRAGRVLLHVVALLCEPWHTLRRVWCHIAGIARECWRRRQ